MLELSVYNQSLELQGVIDTYSSLIWTRKYYTPSTVDLQCPGTVNNLALIKKHNIIEREDTSECVYIRDVKLTSDIEKGTVITAVCDCLSQVLYNRVNEQTGSTIGEVMRNNCVQSSIPTRNVSFLNIDTAFDIAPAYPINSFTNVGESIEYFAREAKWGMSSMFNHVTNKIDIVMLTGLDRSIGQTVNPQVVFSAEFDNLVSCDYQTSDIGSCTNVWISYTVPSTYSEPGYQALAQRALPGNYAGLSLIEKAATMTADMKKEASGAYTETGDPIYIDVIDWGAVYSSLDDVANGELSAPIESVAGIVHPLAYREGWDLGDVVTVYHAAWGITINERVVEAVEVYDNTDNHIDVTFGEAAYTIADKLRRL